MQRKYFDWTAYATMVSLGGLAIRVRGYGVAAETRGAWMQWEQLNMATKNVQGESAVAIRRRCNDARTPWSVDVDKQDRTYI